MLLGSLIDLCLLGWSHHPAEIDLRSAIHTIDKMLYHGLLGVSAPPRDYLNRETLLVKFIASASRAAAHCTRGSGATGRRCGRFFEWGELLLWIRREVRGNLGQESHSELCNLLLTHTANLREFPVSLRVLAR